MAANAHNTSTGPITGRLVLVRHAESEWNVLGKWTGRADVRLTAKGHEDARLAGEALRDIKFDQAYCSEQARTLETLQNILEVTGQTSLRPRQAAALNERDYGEYTGLDKWGVLERLGQDEFDGIRRAWDHPIPGGETLQMVSDRLLPFYQDQIVPELQAGKTILLVSHGNTLRTLVKYLENISDSDIAAVEMPFDCILLFSVTPEGLAVAKEQRAIDITPPHA